VSAFEDLPKAIGVFPGLAIGHLEPLALGFTATWLALGLGFTV